MKKYNSLFGVPFFSYYLIQIRQFADYETPQIEEIIYTSRNKQELIDLCKTNNWKVDSKDGWNEYYIKYKSII